MIIESPSSKHIVNRTRSDINTLDPILRYYITPNEIQFHAEALQDPLEFFLQCKGSKNSLQFTVPSSAVEVNTKKKKLLELFSRFKHLSLDHDHNSHVITATLRRKQLRSELVGRYTCSETTSDNKVETSVFVFIQG